MANAASLGADRGAKPGNTVHMLVSAERKWGRPLVLLVLVEAVWGGAKERKCTKFTKWDELGEH